MIGLHDTIKTFCPRPKSDLGNIQFQQSCSKTFFVSTQRRLTQCQSHKAVWSGETVFKLESSIVDAILNGTGALCISLCPLLNLPLCFAFPPLLSLFCWKLPHKESILGQFKVSSEWLDSAKCTVPLCSKNSIERLFAERQHNAKLREENMGAATNFLCCEMVE